MSTWLPPPPPPNLAPRKKFFTTRRIALVVLSILAVLVILLNLAKATYQSYRWATAAVERFHRQLDQENYEAIYEEASYDFRRSGKREDEIKFLQMVHQKMGAFSKTSPAGFHVNWRTGYLYVDQVFQTTFANGEAQESFIWVIQGNRIWLYGYRINSPNLR
jgi:hypothetical protein